jgi:GxxExxY protein
MAHEELNKLTEAIIGAGIEVHKALGPGFTEKTYARALEQELAERKVSFAVEQAIRLNYKGKRITLNFSRIRLQVKRVAL